MAVSDQVARFSFTVLFSREMGTNCLCSIMKSNKKSMLFSWEVSSYSWRQLVCSLAFVKNPISTRFLGWQ